MKRVVLAHPPYCLAGTLVRVDEQGRAFVDFPDNPSGHQEARLASFGELPGLMAPGTPVLLVFEGGDPSLPLIVGVIRDRLPEAEAGQAVGKEGAKIIEWNIDRRQIRFTATDQVVIQCGRGSITLTSDGSIEIKGTRIVSRASGPHKIRGATVRIN